jgi:hypothetical protein
MKEVTSRALRPYVPEDKVFITTAVRNSNRTNLNCVGEVPNSILVQDT